MIKITTTPDQSREAAEIAANIPGVQVQKSQIKFVPCDGATVRTADESLQTFIAAVAAEKAARGGRQTALASLIRKATEAMADSIDPLGIVAFDEKVAAAPVVAKKSSKKASAKETARKAAAKPKAKATAKTAKTRSESDGADGHSIPRQRGTGSIWVRNNGNKRFLTAISVDGQRQRQLFATQADAEAWLDSFVAA